MARSSSRSNIFWYGLIASTTTAVVAAAVARYYYKNSKGSPKSKSPPPSVSGATTDKDGLILQRFEQCVTHIKPKISSFAQQIQLELYAWYKQATLGDCFGEAPSKFNLVATAKYNAWNQLKGMERTAAMQLYIDKCVLLEFTGEMMADDTLGDLEGEAVMEIEGLGVRQSTLAGNPESEAADKLHDTKFPLHQAARDHDLEKLKTLLETSSHDPNSLDDSGQTALHLAADRGHPDCIELLVRGGAKLEVADNDGISVLQAAVIAGNLECCEMLCKLGADPDQADIDGDSPRSCAQDDPQLAAFFGTLVLLQKMKGASKEDKGFTKEQALKRLDEPIKLDLDDDGDI